MNRRHDILLEVQKPEEFMSTNEEKLRDALRSTPEWLRACESDSASQIITNQHAFAAGYQDEEIYLLGCAIKYAGLHGKRVIIIPLKLD